MRASVHRRDSERTQFPIPFRNEDAFEGLRLIVFRGEIYGGLRFLLWRAQVFPVPAGSAATRGLCHTPHTAGTDAVGAGVDQLPSPDFALLDLVLGHYL